MKQTLFLYLCRIVMLKSTDRMKSFSSKIGVLLAAAGSAVGLGSIWKFPYVVGENGGGAFIILYIVCALVFGLPLVMNEFLIGKLSGRSAYGAFRELIDTGRWQWLSWTFLLSVIVVMTFYFVVTGWGRTCSPSLMFCPPTS